MLKEILDKYLPEDKVAPSNLTEMQEKYIGINN